MEDEKQNPILDAVPEVNNTPHRKALKGWDAVDKRVRDSDESKVEDFKEDVDTLLVFAGLFSAVTTTLLIESYKFLQEDQNDTTNLLLAQVYLHLVNSSSSPPPIERIACIVESSCSFTPSTPARQINYLWFSSLILSLVTASFGMLVKQWLREYLSGNFALGRSHLRLRFFRYIGMVEWRVFKIASLLPLLLQLALALFFTGLCIFSTRIDNRLGSLTTSLVVTWAALLLLILVAPAFSPRCPYKVTFLKEFMHNTRLFLNKYLHVDYHTLDHRQSLFKEITDQKKISASPTEEESFAVNTASLSEDLDILFALDCELVDDELLETGIAGLLIPLTSQSGANMTQVQNPREKQLVNWTLKIIQNRIQNKQATRENPNLRMAFNGQLSLKAWTAIVNLLAYTIISSLGSSAKNASPKGWMADAVTILLSNSGYLLPVNGQKALSECLRMSPSFFADILSARMYTPEFTIIHYTLVSVQEPTGKDAFAILSNSAAGDILCHLHGDDLLQTLYHLLFSLYYPVIVKRKGSRARTLLEFLKLYVFIEDFPRARLDDQGGLGSILDMMFDELDTMFQSELPSPMPQWTVQALSIVFISDRHWNEEHYMRVINWLSHRNSLLSFLQLAIPTRGSHNDLTFRNISESMTVAVVELFTNSKKWTPESVIPVDRKVVLRYLADILKADLDPAVLEDPSNLRIDYVGLCYVLSDLLQWQIQQSPDENPITHRGLVNAWIAVVRGMSAILLALEPAVGLNVDDVRPLVPKIKSMEIPAELRTATDELLLTLQTICLGSAPASRAISHWEGMMAASRRSLRSGYGSDSGDVIQKGMEGTNGFGINGTTIDAQSNPNDVGGPSSQNNSSAAQSDASEMNHIQVNGIEGDNTPPLTE